MKVARKWHSNDGSCSIHVINANFLIDDVIRFWLSRLYHALFPVHVKVGSSADVDLASFPESERGLQVVRGWIRDFFFSASWHGLGSDHFLSAIAEAATLALMFEGGGAQAYFHQAPCVISDRPSGFSRNDNRYIVHDLLDFLCHKDKALSKGVVFVK